MFSLCVLSGTLAVWLIGDSNLAVEKLRNIICLFLCVPYPLLYVSRSRLQLPGKPELDKCEINPKDGESLSKQTTVRNSKRRLLNGTFVKYTSY